VSFSAWAIGGNALALNPQVPQMNREQTKKRKLAEEISVTYAER